MNWYVHGVHVLETVSKFFLFNDGWFQLGGCMFSQTVGIGVHKILINPQSIIMLHYIKVCVFVCVCVYVCV